MTDKNLALHGSLNLKVKSNSVDINFKNKKVLAKLGQNVVAGESLLASN